MIAIDVELLGVPAFVVAVSEDEQDFRYITMNRRLLDVSGFSPEQFVGKPLIECMPANVAERVRANYLRCVVARSAIEYEEYYDVPAGRSWWSTTLAPELGDDGRVLRIVGIAFDITKRRIAEEALANAVYLDHLTGVANRRRLELDVENAMAEAVYSHQTFSLVLIDIDRFKTINDDHGHRVGDEVLRQVASLLTKAFRSTDTIARIGGDEFAVKAALSSELELAALMSSLRRFLDKALASAELPVRVGLSIGAALWQKEQSFEDLLAVADMHMYSDKAVRRAA